MRPAKKKSKSNQSKSNQSQSMIHRRGYPVLTRSQFKKQVIQPVWDELNSIQNALNEDKLTEAIDLLTNLQSPTQVLTASQTVFLGKLTLTATEMQAAELTLRDIEKCLKTNKLYEAGHLLKKTPHPMSERQKDLLEALAMKLSVILRSFSGNDEHVGFHPIRQDDLKIDPFKILAELRTLRPYQQAKHLADYLVRFIKAEALPRSLFVPLIINAPSTADDLVTRYNSQKVKETDLAGYLNRYSRDIDSLKIILNNSYKELTPSHKAQTAAYEPRPTQHAMFIISKILSEWIPEQQHMISLAIEKHTHSSPSVSGKNTNKTSQVFFQKNGKKSPDSQLALIQQGEELESSHP